jgi:hypothetical protein
MQHGNFTNYPVFLETVFSDKQFSEGACRKLQKGFRNKITPW